ncbi:MAG TPA: pre-peptidase C-terminal domain-containing protein [Thermoanaerobaculia bacterium]|nr:pre-peptidase C-terminal domain-containing protein [Thermoanaerobaculia bacterium]
MSEFDDEDFPYPMRIQVAPGSEAEYRHYRTVRRRSDEMIAREALAPGVSASPQDDLIFRGGKVLPQMGFQNIYLGRASDFAPGDVESIDDAITRLMRDEQLQSVIQQYFVGRKLTYDVAPSVMLDENRPNEMDEPDVQNKLMDLFDRNLILASDHDRTVFNLVLPPDTVLKLNGSSSLDGLGGYHGSVHFSRGGQSRTLYYSANVYSAVRAGRRNGIPFFNTPWKNVVCTLYHELIESQTDPDVSDAIRQNDHRFIGFNSNRGQEIGDQPISANSLDRVFREVLTLPGPRATPVQFMYSNAVHGAEGSAEKPPLELVVNGDVLQGVISAGGERDRYTFRVTTAGVHAIETSGSTDTFVSLFGPNSETRLIAEDDDSGPGNLSLLSRDLPTGQYFVRVRHFSPSRTGPYGISVRSRS